ncbi:MAG: elongation factor G [Alphaproteobacteria bacterium]|nr:elongation factor G [Alphaproteobacteria bacterium]
MTERATSTRIAALIGPYTGGKTNLLESILFVTEKILRKGSANGMNRVGDSSSEAKKREMSVETSIASTEFLGDKWTFLDCPGSVEFMQDTYNSLMIADIAIVVCDPDPARAVMVAPILKFLSNKSIPHMIFINKVKNKKAPIRDVFNALQKMSDNPLVLREIPIRNGDEVTGFVDLVSEQAYQYEEDSKHNEGSRSNLIQMSDDVKERKETARFEMLESLADFDDDLMEKLLEDAIPPKDDVYNNIKNVMNEGMVVPVFFGSSEKDFGVHRLLKALRHEIPEAGTAAQRLGLENAGTDKPALAHIFKTAHAQHTGKQSIARIFGGTIKDGMQLANQKVSGLHKIQGADHNKISEAKFGDIVALGKMENVKTGEIINETGSKAYDLWPTAMDPMFAFALKTSRKGDEVKLSGALTKLCNSDASLRVEHNKDTNELLLWGQGEIHLKSAIARLEENFNVAVETSIPKVPYKETISKSIKIQGRHKKQSGGHGQFGDIHIEIKPLPRGEGFKFSNTIVGGAVPKQYIPAVKTGVKEYMAKGPLGFPVVDIAVNLYDGSHHSVDSSEQAFKMAGQVGMRQGMPQCSPTLLEPILTVEVSVPSEWTSKIQSTLSQKRGQIMGFDMKEGWSGWDVVQANLPQSEMYDLIIELRSLTMGVGSFSWKFDRMQELTGRDANIVIKKYGDKRTED